MNPNPKSAKTKIAFTGTNSSGKTTMALEVTARLKSEYHVLAEVVSSQDRKITWKDDHFPVDFRAHYGMICNLIHAEVQAELKGDADVVVTDRSVLDLYSIALTDHPVNALVHTNLKSMVSAWLQTYKVIYYLPPLSYQEDGKRPPDDFRMRTHATLRTLIENWAGHNIIELPRHEVFDNIVTNLGIKKQKPEFAETEKWQHIADTVNIQIAVKPPATSNRDIDVFIAMYKTDIHDEKPTAEWAQGLVNLYFGYAPRVHLMMVPPAAFARLPELGNQFIFYTPQGE